MTVLSLFNGCAGGTISDKQRYSMIGNGWTVDKIAHLFSQIKPRK
jgi:hypothetical protein